MGVCAGAIARGGASREKAMAALGAGPVMRTHARREDFEDLAAPETDRVAEAQQSSNTAHAARPEKIWLALAPVSDPKEAPVA
mmetsp:Transcript_103007/g.261619  ORF Transcript_103007/g.261619 Transcript_103007/m.261619 type:complete len:83 (-) Transcript_103007:213-461(-)